MRMYRHVTGIEAVLKKGTAGELPVFLSVEEAEAVRMFHMTVPSYQATPLVELPHLAAELGVAGICVKDESFRFGLNAFKALGGVYAIARLMCEALELPLEKVDFSFLKSKEVQEKIGDLTFITATDGNHGRGIAWAARQLGQKAVVYLPRGSAAIRVEAIRAEGAQAHVTDMNYDDTVRLAQRKAGEMGWHMVQDTAWEGYSHIPKWIMQGYTTMAHESLEQMVLSGIPRPSHVFLQAGVGAMAAAVLGYLVNRFPENPPRAIIVEPARAACFYKSMVAGDGQPHFVTGDLETVMAGLACGEPNLLAWPIIRDFSLACVSCEDSVAARGMRILGHPSGTDPRIISGESGAVGTGLLSLIMQQKGLEDLRDALGLNRQSRVLLFSTEGDTDPENYRKIVWDGKYPSFVD